MTDYGGPQRAIFLRKEPKPLRIVFLILAFFLACFLAGYLSIRWERATAPVVFKEINKCPPGLSWNMERAK